MQLFKRVEPKRTWLKNEIGEKLGCMLDEEKVSVRPVTLVRMRVTAKAHQLIFKELLRELCPRPVLE
ncbi:hypothetical protein [Nostoc sp.]